MKNEFLVSLIAALLLVFSAAHADQYWSGEDPNDNYLTSDANWWSGSAPGPGEMAVVSRPGYPVEIDNGMEPVEYSALRFWNDNTFSISGSEITTVGEFSIGYGSSSATAQFNMSGGTINCGGWSFGIGRTSDAVMNMSGGTLNITNKLIIPNTIGSYGTLNFSGGTINSGNYDFSRTPADTAALTISNDAKLVIAGDVSASLNQDIADGKIVAATGKLLVSYDDEINKTTLDASGDPNIADNPSPTDGTGDVLKPVELSWAAGENAAEHDLYISTELEDIEEADSSLTVGDIYKGRLSSPTFTPTVEYGKTYYWRVDEVSGSQIWEGEIWSFSLVDHIMIEDFQSYKDTGISGTWIEEGYASVSLSGVARSHEGVQDSNSIDIYYANFPDDYSQATRSFSSPQDWSNPELPILRTHFMGYMNNQIQPFYITLEDSSGNSATAYYYDPQQLSTAPDGSLYDWKTFNVSLPEMSIAGVNTAAVKKLSIGVGNDPENQGVGHLFIDDIMLHSPDCVAPEHIAEGDFNWDCEVNEEDLEMFVNHRWLQQERTVNAQSPDDNHLLVHYAFDNDLTDSSGSGFDATSDSPQFTSGKTGNAIQFDQTYTVQVPKEVMATVENEITVSFWLKVDNPTDKYDTFVSVFTADKSNDRTFQVTLNPYNLLLAHSGTNYYQNQETDTLTFFPDTIEEIFGSWINWTIVKDAAHGTTRLYRNGLLVQEQFYTETALNGSQVAANGAIGLGGMAEPSWEWGWAAGSMDEFKIYDYALSGEEVLTLAGESSVYQPILEQQCADKNSDGIVNIADFAEMSGWWLTEQLWP